VDEAGLEADSGFAPEAREHALAALKLAPDSMSTQSAAALALARIGYAARAQTEAAKAVAQSPLDTILNSAEIASVHAAIQLEKHDPGAAIQSLEQARPYDLCSSMGLAPAYYRGLAYLENKDFDKAVQEFKRVIDHRLLVPDSPYIGLSYLSMGRAFQLEDHRAEAARAYQDAAAIWKDADPTFPPFKQLNAYRHELDIPGR